MAVSGSQRTRIGPAPLGLAPAISISAKAQGSALGAVKRPDAVSLSPRYTLASTTPKRDLVI